MIEFRQCRHHTFDIFWRFTLFGEIWSDIRYKFFKHIVRQALRLVGLQDTWRQKNSTKEVQMLCKSLEYKCLTDVVFTCFGFYLLLKPFYFFLVFRNQNFNYFFGEICTYCNFTKTSVQFAEFAYKLFYTKICVSQICKLSQCAICAFQSFLFVFM